MPPHPILLNIKAVAVEAVWAEAEERAEREGRLRVAREPRPVNDDREGKHPWLDQFDTLFTDC